MNHNSSSPARLTGLRGPAAALLLTLALGACGGGGGDRVAFPILPPSGGDGTTTPPAQQSASDKFVTFVRDLIQTALDTSEPVDVTAYDPPPTSDTTEPLATP